MQPDITRYLIFGWYQIAMLYQYWDSPNMHTLKIISWIMNSAPTWCYMWPTGLWPSPAILGWPPESCMGASPTTPDTFSSSRRFKHAALGLRLRSDRERETNFQHHTIITEHCVEGEHNGVCVTDLWLVVLDWGWHWRLGVGWEVWSEVCHDWGAAGTSGPAPWTPRWCPVLGDARGRCWPPAVPAPAPSSPRAGGPRPLLLDWLQTETRAWSRGPVASTRVCYATFQCTCYLCD